VINDSVHHGIVCEEGDDAHLAAPWWAGQRVDFKNPAAHFGPAVAGDSRALLFNEDEGMLVGLCLSHLLPVGVPVEAVISHSDAFGLKKPWGSKGGMPLWSQGEAREGEGVSEASVGRGKAVVTQRKFKRTDEQKFFYFSSRSRTQGA